MGSRTDKGHERRVCGDGDYRSYDGSKGLVTMTVDFTMGQMIVGYEITYVRGPTTCNFISTIDGRCRGRTQGTGNRQRKWNLTGVRVQKRQS